MAINWIVAVRGERVCVTLETSLEDLRRVADELGLTKPEGVDRMAIETLKMENRVLKRIEAHMQSLNY